MFSGLFDCISYMFLCGDGQNKATGLLFNTPDDFLECAKQLMSDGGVYHSYKGAHTLFRGKKDGSRSYSCFFFAG
eukprot:m.133372 g.133372  ORF g.133372 m.133372 type:complete len:75 (+) comp15799_c0_seq3:186-410(+)